MPFVDVLFGHEGDLSATLGTTSHAPPWHDPQSYSQMAARVAAEFPTIKVLATTTRRPHTASRNDWSAFAFAAGHVYQSRDYLNLDILDRVGGGDSFAAGLIYGLLEDKGMQYALECGTAHGALAMTTPGDSSMAALPEVEALMRSPAGGVLR